MRIEKPWIRRLTLGAFLLCAAALAWLLRLETIPRQEAVYLVPESVTGAPDMENLVSYAGSLSFDYSLPAWEGKSRPILQIYGLDTMAVLRLDGAPFLQIPAGLNYCYVTLPGDYVGKTLTLAMEKREIDPVPSLYLTDSGVMREQNYADACLNAFPTAAFGMGFLLTLGLFLYGWLEGTRPYAVLLLSVAALGQTGYFYLKNFPNFTLPPALYGLALHQSYALLFAAPPLYLLLNMKKYRKMFTPFVILPALIYWIVAGFQTVIPLFAYSAVHAGVVFCFTIVALVVCAVLEYRDGNPVFRRFLPCLGMCVGGVVLLGIVFAVRTGTIPPTLQMLLINIQVPYLDIELYKWNSLLLALCMMESVVSHVQRMTERETEIQALSVRESLTQEQLTTVQESAAALREMRHEVKNHYLILQYLHQAGETERLTSYLSELATEISSIPALVYAPHPTINAVLTIMLARAQKQGVTVERKIDVPETLPFPDTELCSVLMNLLQNALDANAKAPKGARKWLRVDLHIQGVHLYIGVENARFASIDYDEESGLCRTTKPDKSAHGYGLKAVRAIARKYQSELLLQFSNDSFSASIALQTPD